jgi:hypothetical protein
MLSKEVNAPVVMNADSPTLLEVKRHRAAIHPLTDLLATVIGADMVVEVDILLVVQEFAMPSKEANANVARAADTATPLVDLPVTPHPLATLALLVLLAHAMLSREANATRVILADTVTTPILALPALLALATLSSVGNANEATLADTATRLLLPLTNKYLNMDA